LTPELAKDLRLDVNAGALVAEVAEGSAAESAGLQVGDVIVALNGASLPGVMALRNRIGLLRVGETVRLTVIRKWRTLELDATLQERPEKG
jgi:serine protease DegQ